MNMEDTNVFAKKPAKDELWDTIIIGSGPAALTAAIYTTRGAASTLIIGGDVWGGQLMLTTTVDNFPGFDQGVQGPELMEKMKNQAVRFGAEFVAKNALELKKEGDGFVVKTSDETYRTRSVIVATGASTVWLDAPGVKELIGKGVSSCAPCDAPFYKGKRVAVVGGGDSAMEESLVLAKYATEVTIIHRRDEFRASAAMQKKVLSNPKIKILYNSELVEAVGKDKLEKIIIKNNKDTTTSELVIDGLFIAIGHKPESDIVKGILDIDERGYIVKNQKSKIKSQNFEDTGTATPGIFVAGDVHDFTYKQAITAAGYGCQAGMDALGYLDNK
jgi:thioredoxin reductase (NADPH)